MSANIKQKVWSLVRDPARLSAPTRTTGWTQKAPIPRLNFIHISKRSSSRSGPGSHSHVSQKPIVSKSFATASLLFVDLSSPVTASPISSCTSTTGSLYTSPLLSQRPFQSLAQLAWRREIHSSARRGDRGSIRRNQSSKANGPNGRAPPQNAKELPKVPRPVVKEEADASKTDPPSASYLHLPHMPKLPHRPTKEELLAAATGFWSRLKVRFKWFSIRSARPWNIDDWSAFVSWFVLGNIVWILVGTTTFFSLVILSINTVVAQGMNQDF